MVRLDPAVVVAACPLPRDPRWQGRLEHELKERRGRGGRERWGAFGRRLVRVQWRIRGSGGAEEGRACPPAFAASEFQLLLRAAWEGAPRPLLLPRAGSSASSREEREAGPLLTVLVVRHGRL
jgi:hypothetical protein